MMMMMVMMMMMMMIIIIIIIIIRIIIIINPYGVRSNRTYLSYRLYKLLSFGSLLTPTFLPLKNRHIYVVPRKKEKENARIGVCNRLIQYSHLQINVVRFRVNLCGNSNRFVLRQLQNIRPPVIYSVLWR
jgi:hypothetical protein